MSVQVGTLVVQDTPRGPKVWTIGSITTTGRRTLLRASDAFSEKGSTTKGFAQALAAGELEGWRVLNTARVDQAVADAIASR